jgi:hypothetical protein
MLDASPHMDLYGVGRTSGGERRRLISDHEPEAGVRAQCSCPMQPVSYVCSVQFATAIMVFTVPVTGSAFSAAH